MPADNEIAAGRAAMPAEGAMFPVRRDDGDGGQAFPGRKRIVRRDPDGSIHVVSDAPTPGMTLRDYFAGQALVGIGDWCPEQRGDGSYGIAHAEQQRRRAVWAYEQADAMLKARGA